MSDAAGSDALEGTAPAGNAAGGDLAGSRGNLRPRLDVHPVPEGSVLVLTGAVLARADLAQQLVAEIESACGHRRFALLLLGDGAFDVWGPDTDLKAKLLELLPPVQPRHPDAVQSPDELVPGPVAGPGAVVTSRAELERRAASSAPGSAWAREYEDGRRGT